MIFLGLARWIKATQFLSYMYLWKIPCTAHSELQSLFAQGARQWIIFTGQKTEGVGKAFCGILLVQFECTDLKSPYFWLKSTA